MSIAKQIILDELESQTHPEWVEDVIFDALEFYANSGPKGISCSVAYAIKERIKEAEAITANPKNPTRKAKKST
ncbi:hypothetical protein SAMN05421780_101571 [Flexibacter flexilis DSM 6793]|uniref:Uncharacterized protein n=1 Tax=Flexibacter flexilis DSM 6793 TaxID=927664 RepID=A0A1I1E7B5_9BACT|nr:hypothetical protein [Flexibacter flexilis]SFB80850.1 hypothetical protein SAMN05421780_101571 [Flexibacter flexilis DSM 6793]